MSRLLFLSNHFITLYAFRKEIIERCIADGHEVFLSLPKDEDNIFFENMGCKIILTKIDRRGLNPIKDIKLLLNYYNILRHINPDFVFSYTIKPNIYGSIASRFAGFKQICNITGTGATFLRRDIVSRICVLLYKSSVKYSYKVFFQNSSDRDFFIKHGMVKNNYDMLPGSGVNLEEHPFSPLPESDKINFIYIGRVMKLKGIDEYLKCAKLIHEKYPNTVFYIAGWNEEPFLMCNVKECEKLGYVHYLGFRKDIIKWVEKCHCIIHPAHGGEGISNVMLECAAMGRICIASDISGCREIVDNGISGYLFKKEDVDDLVNKVEMFISLNRENMAVMAKAARKRVEMMFDRNFVVDKYLNEIADLRKV